MILEYCSTACSRTTYVHVDVSKHWKVSSVGNLDVENLKLSVKTMNTLTKFIHFAVELLLPELDQ